MIRYDKSKANRTKKTRLLLFSSSVVVAVVIAITNLLRSMEYAVMLEQVDNIVDDNYEEIPIEFLWWFVESTLAVITLIAVTIFLGCLLELGCRTGGRIATQSQPFVRPEGCLRDYNVLGMVCYGGWMCIVGLLIKFQ